MECFVLVLRVDNNSGFCCGTSVNNIATSQKAFWLRSFLGRSFFFFFWFKRLKHDTDLNVSICACFMIVIKVKILYTNILAAKKNKSE